MIKLENVFVFAKLLMPIIILLMMSQEAVYLLVPWCCIKLMGIGSLFNVSRTAPENNSEIKLLNNVYITVQILLFNILLIIELLIVLKYVQTVHMPNQLIIHASFNVQIIHMDIWKNVFPNVLQELQYTMTIQLGFVL